MAQSGGQQSVSYCKTCGFEAAGSSDDWDRVESPSFGRMTSCPECGSTDVTLRR